MKLADLTINRSGQVNWHVVPGTTHCGPAALVKTRPMSEASVKTLSFLVVRYEVALTCAPKLDKRGFLIDQVNVHAYIERYAATPRALSCEEGCIALAEAIIAKASKDAPHCAIKELSLVLSPEPHLASIRAHFVV